MSRKTRLITAALLAMLLSAIAGIALAANLEVTFTWTVDGQAFPVLLDKQDRIIRLKASQKPEEMNW